MHILVDLFERNVSTFNIVNKCDNKIISENLLNAASRMTLPTKGQRGLTIRQNRLLALAEQRSW